MDTTNNDKNNLVEGPCLAKNIKGKYLISRSMGWTQQIAPSILVGHLWSVRALTLCILNYEMLTDALRTLV